MDNSIKNFLLSLHSSMTNGEQFRIDITRNNDSLDLILLPVLGDNEDKVPEEAKAVRSALSMPLAMRNMTIEELSAEFSLRLSGYGAARQQAGDAYKDLLATLQDATATAKNTKANTKSKNKEPTKSITSEVASDSKKADPVAQVQIDEKQIAKESTETTTTLFDF